MRQNHETSELSESRFWRVEGRQEFLVVYELMVRRFGGLVDELNQIFDRCDPHDLVYPGNPDEYSGPVLELLVLLEHERPNDPASLEDLVKRSLDRCIVDDENVLETTNLSRLVYEVGAALAKSRNPKE